MSNGMPIQDAVDRVLAELQRLQYSETSQTAYRRFYQRVLAYADAHGVTPYSEALGRQFVEATYGCAWPELSQPLPPKLSGPVRYLASLTDVQLHGTVLRRRRRNHPYEPPVAFQPAFAAFVVECGRRGYSPTGSRTRWHVVRLFLTFVGAQTLTLDTLRAEHVSRFAATLMDYHPKTVLTILTNLRTFLRFLHTAGFHGHDLSTAVPRVRSGRYERLPSVWPADTVQRLLAVVDRGNPTGKRDYAILLLAARLGMRVGDIKALTLTAVHWDTKTLAVIQQKTGRAVEYPLLDDVGWALIEYLQHGRPPTASPEIFVRHQAPFEPFGLHANLHTLITKYARRAGIAPSGRRGLHALRHTLASTLLEHDTPLPIIAEILGHLSTQSTQVYLAVDRAGLARCALNPEAVFDYADR